MPYIQTKEGIVLPAPAFGSGQVTIATNVDGGRNESGNFIGQVVGDDKLKIECSFSYMEPEDFMNFLKIWDRLQRVSFSWESGYELTAEDVFGNPTGTKLDNCRNVVVLLDNRTAGDVEEIKTATITAGEETWIEHGDMYQDVTAATTTEGATLSFESYAFATKVTASGVTGDVEIVLSGKKLVQGSEDRRTVAVGTAGEDCEIENPLLSASSLKPGYLDWLAAHFARSVEWKAETLGYPELQPGDPVGYKGMRGSILDADVTYRYSLRENFVVRKEETS